MTLGLNREETKEKYTYQKRLTNCSWKIVVDYATWIHWFEFYPCCSPKKILGKKKTVPKEAWKIKINNNIELWKKSNDKREIKYEIIKEF